MPFHPLAEAANEALAKHCPHALEMLSALGKRIYFPTMGIINQSAEAKTKAKRYNATIGIAMENGKAMHMACVHRYFAGLEPDDCYTYAHSSGRPDLRTAWLAKIREDTPSLGQHPVSQPVVTNALTHGLSLAGDLFLDPGDEILVADKLWENYDLNWGTRQGARLVTYPLFDERLAGFNLVAFRQALAERRGRKLVVTLNFPNNPTGYSATRDEAAGIVEALTAAAAAGGKLVVFCDDAYYGMFFDEACERESLFGRLARAHPNLLAVKLDGPTKEMFVWGLRVGFLTFGIANGTEAAYKALEWKASGLVRAGVSNITHPGQSIVLRVLRDPEFRRQQREKIEILRSRSREVGRVARDPRYADCWDVYPFNSGYFMCLRLKGAQADKVRQHLLDAHGVGTISIDATDLRVAFSCVEEKDIADLFERIAQGVRTVRG